MNVLIERFSYSSTETEGEMYVGDHVIATIERPWIAGVNSGGLPFESCVPDGEYVLAPWVRPSGEECYILSAPDLGVRAEEMAGSGRYLILMHVANFVSQVVGCIAPGMTRSIMWNKSTGSYERAVSSSVEAMRVLRSFLGRSDSHTLTIRPRLGTGEDR